MYRIQTEVIRLVKLTCQVMGLFVWGSMGWVFWAQATYCDWEKEFQFKLDCKLRHYSGFIEGYLQTGVEDTKVIQSVIQWELVNLITDLEGICETFKKKPLDCPKIIRAQLQQLINLLQQSRSAAKHVAMSWFPDLNDGMVAQIRERLENQRIEKSKEKVAETDFQLRKAQLERHKARIDFWTEQYDEALKLLNTDVLTQSLGRLAREERGFAAAGPLWTRTKSLKDTEDKMMVVAIQAVQDTLNRFNTHSAVLGSQKSAPSSSPPVPLQKFMASWPVHPSTTAQPGSSRLTFSAAQQPVEHSPVAAQSSSTALSVSRLLTQDSSGQVDGSQEGQAASGRLKAITGLNQAPQDQSSTYLGKTAKDP